MPEHIRAYIVVTAISLLVFWLAVKRSSENRESNRAVNFRLVTWQLVSACAFLSPQYWVFIVFTGLICLAASRIEKNPLALYTLLLFAAPPIQGTVPGLGLFNFLFEIDYWRLLALTILAPVVWQVLFGSAKPSGRQKPYYAACDFFLLGFILYGFALNLQFGSLTAALRGSIWNVMLDYGLLYFAFSRSLVDKTKRDDALQMLLLGLSVQACIAGFEYTRNWLLYPPLADSLGQSWALWDLGAYLLRGELLRAQGSTGHALHLGTLLLVAICLTVSSRTSVIKRPQIIVFLFIGLGAALSRGPALATACALGLWLIARSMPIKQAITVFVFFLTASGVALASVGGRIQDLLPILAKVDEGGITYRQQLFEVSMLIIQQNPFTGASRFMQSEAMQSLRQGQGIIDLVNVYVGVALSSGLLGLFFFSGFFITAFVKIARCMIDMKGFSRSNPSPFMTAILCGIIGLAGLLATISLVSATWLAIVLIVSFGLAASKDQHDKNQADLRNLAEK